MKVLCICVLLLLAVVCAAGQDNPYFVTYDHHLEERGTLVISNFATMGAPSVLERGQNFFVAPYMEMEYGVTNRLTAAVYWEAQGTRNDSALFTGWRLETRFRPLKREHFINPVLYLEYENVNDASRIHKDVVGEGPELDERNADLRAIRNHELETKLILSSDVHHWNFSENFVVDKNLSRGDGYEFGYAFAVAHPLAIGRKNPACRFCPDKAVVGLELYGGLGNTNDRFGIHDCAHYLAPAFSYELTPNSTFRFSAGAGLGHEGSSVLLRAGYSYEFHGFGVGRLFGRRKP
jgi:hypothetical protein